jgi:hypothetical protein
MLHSLTIWLAVAVVAAAFAAPPLCNVRACALSEKEPSSDQSLIRAYVPQNKGDTD